MQSQSPGPDASPPPNAAPRANPEALPRAVFRCSPEDFIVDEIPAYTPCGRGEHLFVTFRKTGVTTESAVRSIAHALSVDPRGAGYAGMKDKVAVATQTASFPVPIAHDPAPALAAATLPGIEILSAARHENKLKPGHLIGNRFRIVLRQIEGEASAATIRERLLEIGRVGVPNAFGPQRFGRDGENPTRFLTWLQSGGPRSRERRAGPRDKREQRLLFSALQSLLFNRVLEERERDGTWFTVLPGDLAKKNDTGGLFLVPLDGPELDDARERARSMVGGISATGPMFGAKMRWPEGAPRDIELRTLKAVLDERSLTLPEGGSEGGSKRAPITTPEEVSALFEPLRHLGEGTRRSLRLQVTDLAVEVTESAGSCSRALAVSFVLPKGGYATTVLARACQLVETRGGPLEGDQGQNVAIAGNDGNDDGVDAHPEE